MNERDDQEQSKEIQAQVLQFKAYRYDSASTLPYLSISISIYLSLSISFSLLCQYSFVQVLLYGIVVRCWQ
jgi:hypothetical protein